jgi:hypothetical protein
MLTWDQITEAEQEEWRSVARRAVTAVVDESGGELS